jgi:hypothetical protein
MIDLRGVFLEAGTQRKGLDDNEVDDQNMMILVHHVDP